MCMLLRKREKRSPSYTLANHNAL
uniref:Uncharacterized protein n=1 Tax=Anguilla anguilla TaxID=7936 RepID=A0A0E9SAZ9_ANGAN